MDNKNAKTYLKFDKNRMVNLEYSLEREILRTNRRGAYHCTTLVECNTRKQHGLLVMPVPEFGNTSHVLLSSFDETIIQHGAEFNLGIHKYDGNNYSPMGHKYIREFDCDTLPRTIYRIGGVILSKEKMFSLHNNTIFIRYKLLDAHSPTTIRFKPFLAFREANSLAVENYDASLGYREIQNGIVMRMYPGYPDLYMAFNKNVNFVFDPHWYKGIEYKKDMEEGLPYKEDLYVPGYFEMPIKKGETIVFCASDTQPETSSLPELFEDGIKKRTPRSSFFNCLKNSGHQFYYKPSPNELYLMNGYPWGSVTARDQFLALPGLTLYIDRFDAFDEIMDTAIPQIRRFMEGKPLTGMLSDISNPDVLLTIVRALIKLSEFRRDHFLAKYSALVSDIIDFIRKGKYPGLRMTKNKLLYVEDRSSWISSPAKDESIIQRTGYLVENNAFWYNSLMFDAENSKALGDTKRAQKISKLAAEVKESFVETFLNEYGYLYDYVDGDYADWNVRANMLLAISIEYPILDKRQSKTMLDIITKELLTPKGVRTLSPKSAGFSPRFEGTAYEKKYSDFNGAAWPWLMGFYLESYMKIFQLSGVSFLSRILIGLEEEMANDCIGSLSEVYDGSLPYRGHGAVSYAISVAGAIRAVKILQSVDGQY